MKAIKKILQVFLFYMFCFTSVGYAGLSSSLERISLEPIQVSKHVYYFRGESGVANKGNKGFMSNAGFVVTKDGVVVFDALATPVLGAAMVRAIKTITDQPIKKIIVSHYHADHFYGLQSMKSRGVSVIAHENGKKYLKSDEALLRLAQRKQDLFPWVDEKTNLVVADEWLSFKENKSVSFALGGIRFQIIDSSGAHSSEDIMLYVENDQVLFAGDLFFTGRIPFVGNADSKKWLQALSRMLDIAPKIVIPGHGNVSTTPSIDMQLTKTYLLYLREKMGQAVQEMMSFDDAYQNTDWRMFEKYPAFQAANRLNAFGTYLLMEKESLEKH